MGLEREAIILSLKQKKKKKEKDMEMLASCAVIAKLIYAFSFTSAKILFFFSLCISLQVQCLGAN